MIKKSFIVVSIGLIGTINPMEKKSNSFSFINQTLKQASWYTKRFVPYIIPMLVSAESPLPSNTTVNQTHQLLNYQMTIPVAIGGGLALLCCICACNNYVDTNDGQPNNARDNTVHIEFLPCTSFQWDVHDNPSSKAIIVSLLHSNIPASCIERTLYYVSRINQKTVRSYTPDIVKQPYIPSSIFWLNNKEKLNKEYKQLMVIGNHQ